MADPGSYGPVLIDIRKPEISVSSSTPSGPYSAGDWTNEDVTVSFACADDTSGVASCVGDTTFAAEGANQSATATATDQAGNTASVTVSDINIDKTAPVTAAVASRAPDHNGWYNSPFSVAW